MSETVENKALPFPSLSLKEGLVILPAVATAIAVAFDVGYFYGLDINFFTLFSLSEHILFAIEALPYALMMILTCAIALPLIYRAHRNFREFISRLKKHTALIETLVFAAIVVVIVGPIVIYCIWTGYDSFITKTVSFPAACLAFALAEFVTDQPEPRKLFVVAVTAACGLLLSAYLLGAVIAIEYASATNLQTHTLVVGDREVRGRLIRSGEKGILFVDLATHVAVFYKWDDVKTLSMTPGAETAYARGIIR